MDFVRFSIDNPVKVAVGVLLLMLFGILSLLAIPVQLTPNVDQPMIQIETVWTGRSPEEVEREIVEEQEDKLDSIQGLRKMIATASQGMANIQLEFYVGTDMRRAAQEVSDKLREVPEYPEDVDEPVVNVGPPAIENAIAWMILDSSDPDFDVASIYDEVDKRVKPYLERVTGLSEINVYGGRERQVHVQVHPQRLAERGITFNQLADALRRENVNVSAGDIASGRLDVRVRTIGQYDDVEQVRQTIVAYAEGGPVRVGDLGEVTLTFEKVRSFVRSRGKPGLAINAIRETGANVMQVMEGLQQRIDEVNRTVLPQLGPGLKITQVYDETGYIDDAIALVTDNIWQGGALAVIVLLMFLAGRQSPRLVLFGVPTLIALMVIAMLLPVGTPRTAALAGLWGVIFVALIFSPPTAIIGLSIPISIVGTFLIMALAGRNINVVSLAGLAFATGNVVNAAIVVLENIDRHLGMGKPPRKAAYDGTREVWPSVFNTTLTTLAVFVPVIFVQEEAGQLFRDISLAICASVGLSMIVAITVIPAASARWLRPHPPVHDHTDPAVRRSVVGRFGGFASGMGNATAGLVYLLCGSTVARLAVVGFFTIASLVGAWVLMPPTTYLPGGNQNLVFGIMLTPPGYNIEQARSIGHRVEANIRPYWEATSYEETAKLPPVIDFATGAKSVSPPMENYFFVSWNGTIFMGASSLDDQNVAPLANMLTMNMGGIPGSFGLAFQDSLFGTGLGGTNTIDVELSGDNLDDLRAASGALYMQITGQYGQQSVQPTPLNFNLAGPELQVKIDRVRAADLGIDVAALGLGVEALVDGAIIGDYRYQGDAIDLLLIRDPELPLTTDVLEQVPLAYDLGGVAAMDADGRELPSRGVVPLSSVARLEMAQAPQEIRRIEQRRAITLTVNAPPGEPLEQTKAAIAGMQDTLRAQGAIPQTVEVALAGTADKLTQVRTAFLGEWTGFNVESLLSLLQSRMFIALLITFLVMAALFESWLYPFVIMFTVPLALVGGFMGLWLVHYWQPTQLLDVLTMLGFVILVGIVVDNATLLVYQALNYMRGFGESEEDIVERLAPREAIRESVRTRLRPIMMNSLTNVFGMLPLVVMPGSGSELYRGLGSVVLGGLLVSTVFTLLVVPLLFSLVLDMKIGLYRRMGWEIKELGVSGREGTAGGAAPGALLPGLGATPASPARPDTSV